MQWIFNLQKLTRNTTESDYTAQTPKRERERESANDTEVKMIKYAIKIKEKCKS